MARKATTGPARFTRRFTDAQKDALLRAHLVGGHTVGEVIGMANAGQLDVPAFEIGAYAYDIIRDGREGYEERNDDALTLAVATELRLAENDALGHIRAIRRSFKRGESDPDALTKATKALSAIRRARREAAIGQPKPKAPVNTPVHTDDQPRETPSVVADLLASVDRGARTGSLSDARTGPAAA